MAATCQTPWIGLGEIEQQRRPLTRAKTASELQTLSSNATSQKMATSEVHGWLDTFSRPRGPTASQSTTSLRPASRDARSSSEPSQWPMERSESLARSLLSKSSLFLRRKNSKAGLTSFHAIEWDEEQDDRPGSRGVQELSKRRRSKHGRLTSTNYESILKQSISDPFNFQHLTHTSESHAKALQTATKKSHNELISEFSALRASQAAHKELKGIRAEDISGRSLSRQDSFLHENNTLNADRGAPSTPPFETELNLSPTSRDATRSSPVNRKGLRISQSVDNFSRISPRSFSSPSPPRSPPPRRSSRSAVHLPLDAIGKSPSPFKSNPLIARDGIIIPHNDLSRQSSVEDCTSLLAQHDPSSVGNAVSTLDNSAYTLRPQMSSSSIALADVPEEEEASESMRQSIQGLGLTIATTRPNQRTSPVLNEKSVAPSKLDAEPELVPAVPQQPTTADESDPSTDASKVSDTRSSVATQTDTTLTTSFMDSWEDDIDYCYEHAAEADCAFDWDRMSRDDERRASASDRIIEEIIDSAASSFHRAENEIGYTSSPVTGSKLQLIQPTDPQPWVYTYVDPRHIKAPSLARSTLSATSSTIFASEALTPSEAASSPSAMRFPRRYERESGIFPASPSLLTLQDYERRIAEDASYPGKGPREGREALDSVTELPFYEPRFAIAGLSGEESSCSSANPLSQCSSRDSLLNFMHATSYESFHGNTSSISSLPELVHSSHTSGRESLADKDLATKLSKASISVDTTEMQSTAATAAAEDVSPTTVTPGSAHSLGPDAQTVRRERSLSDCPERVLSPSVAELNRLPSGSSSGSATPNTANKSFAGRMRSASAATTASGMAKKSRASYSLFPSVPVPASR